MSLSEHEAFSYERQVATRGLVRSEELRPAFDKMAATYRYYFRKINLSGPALDLACGYGNFLYFLRTVGIEARGVDLDPHQVELCASLGLTATVGEALQELSRARGLGALSVLDFIEHIDKDAAIGFLQAAYTAVRPGGHLILRLPSADGPFGAHDFANDITHKWVASANLMDGLLKAVGFHVLAIHDDYPAPVHAKGALRYLVYRIAAKLFALPVIVLGMTPPRIWTRSMWIVATRP